jgi:sterol desaturase/sphingolipid hydroxylase (fatty acid hydroxylase superfamily)
VAGDNASALGQFFLLAGRHFRTGLCTRIVIPLEKTAVCYPERFLAGYVLYVFQCFSISPDRLRSSFGCRGIGIRNLVAIQVGSFPYWSQLLILFLVRDFIQWNTHRLLHWSPRLWKFHKVHHSVEEMGYAAHLRYHFMETIVYRAIEYLPLAMIGFGISDFMLVYVFTLAIGHLNHANIYLPLGPLRYIFNSPQMHIWHHAKTLPKGSYGVNYGITLSVWDYLFGSVWMPYDGRDIELGFPDVEKYPHGFIEQVIEPFKE